MAEGEGREPMDEPFGPWLKRELGRVKKTQANLADQLGVSRSLVAIWIAGKSEPRDEVKTQIGDFLAVAMDVDTANLPEDQEPFGPWLERHLRAVGKNQSELAAYLGLTRAAVSAWTTGVALPRRHVEEQIAEFLNVSVKALRRRGPRVPDCPTWCAKEEGHDSANMRPSAPGRTHLRRWGTGAVVKVRAFERYADGEVIRQPPTVHVEVGQDGLTVTEAARLQVALASALLAIAEDGEASEDASEAN